MRVKLWGITYIFTKENPRNMNISHEVPLALLETSKFFNDFDYALVHLFEKYPEYLDFYMKSVKAGRTVYLDNSLYELGEAFDPKAYVDWINTLRPTYYIVPDTFWDTSATIVQAMDWLLNHNPSIKAESKMIGVAQGATYEDIRKCYRFMCSVMDMVAFTFKFPNNFVENSGKFFRDNYMKVLKKFQPFLPDCSEREAIATIEQAIIRCAVLDTLYEDGVIDKTKPHHLLGLQNTLGLEWLKEHFSSYNWLTSIDTSNPIINGLIGKPYKPHQTICGGRVCNDSEAKPKEVLADFFENQIDKMQFDIIKHNVLAFRKLAGNSLEQNYSIIRNEYEN